jgi:hypothetical protein
MTDRKVKKLDISDITSAIISAIGVIIAAIAVLIGSCQFRRGQEFEHDSKAVQLFIKYNELMKDRANSTQPAAAKENQWRENLAIAIAEAIFRLESKDRGWKKTVRWMVLDHTDFLKSNGLNCETFDADFIKLVNQELQQNVCSDQRNR